MALAMLPVAAFAQSTYEPIGGTGSQAEQKAGISVDELLAAGKETAEEKAYRENFVADLQATARKINANSDQWAREIAKRGYPKKKTAREKAKLVEHYVFLLNTQLSDSRLNRFVDKQKVQEKITYWQNYLTKLQNSKLI